MIEARDQPCVRTRVVAGRDLGCKSLTRIMARWVTSIETENQKNTKNNPMNVVAKEIPNALFLGMHSLVDNQVLDTRVLFHTTLHQKIMQNYVVGDFGNMYTANGETLDVVRWISHF